MQLGYVLHYVRDVRASLQFYERAFGLRTRFLHDSGAYGELDTGDTVMGFVREDQARESLAGAPFVGSEPGKAPLGAEVGLVTDDVAGAFRRATTAGATPIVPPLVRPWGQTVAFVRDLDGLLVELCTPTRGA